MTGARRGPAGTTVPSALESRVLPYVAQGWTGREIGAELGVSRSTVNGAICALRRKFAVPTKARLGAAAQEAGILAAQTGTSPHDFSDHAARPRAATTTGGKQ